MQDIRTTLSIHNHIITLVSSGKLSSDAGAVAHFITKASDDIYMRSPLLGDYPYVELSGQDIRDCISVKSPSVGYRVVKECVNRGVLDVEKKAGQTNRYKPSLDFLHR